MGVHNNNTRRSRAAKQKESAHCGRFLFFLGFKEGLRNPASLSAERTFSKGKYTV